MPPPRRNKQEFSGFQGDINPMAHCYFNLWKGLEIRFIGINLAVTRSTFYSVYQMIPDGKWVKIVELGGRKQGDLLGPSKLYEDAIHWIVV